MKLSYRAKDRLAVFFGVLFLIFLAAMIVGNLWLYFLAPCEYVDWMPTKDVPNRCMSVDVR